MQIIDSANWNPVAGLSLEQNALEAVRCVPNVLVSAGPGSGKTELLAQKACYLLQTGICRYPQRILAISFKKDAAKTLKERVIARCGDDVNPRFASLTFDAFAKLILDRFRLGLDPESRPNKQYEIVDKYSSSDGKTKLSFGQVMRLATKIVTDNPNVRAVIRITYPFVFLDEFQDTTGCQYALVTACFGECTEGLTAVGDSDQRIMVWAGAMNDVFQRFRKDYSAKQLTLSCNYRSAPRLVSLQSNMRALMNSPDVEIRVDKRWKADDGIIKLFESANDGIEAGAIARDISERINAGVKPDEICVLCKMKPAEYARNLQQHLESLGVASRVESEIQDIRNGNLASLFIEYMRYCDGPDKNTRIDELIAAYSLGNGLFAEDDDKSLEFIEQLSTSRGKLMHILQEDPIPSRVKSFVAGIINVFGGSKGLKRLFSEYSSGLRLKEDLRKFCELFGESLRKSSWSLRAAISDFMGENRVPIMTVHKSKGLEYRCVYFLGLEDRAFFNFRTQAEEDRCVFFVALSRAKEYLVFSYCNKRSSCPQSHDSINEFFDLLKRPGMAEVIQCDNAVA